MMYKITDWIKGKGSYLKDWVYNKKPRNKYLRIAYYFLTGLIPVVLATLLFFIGFVFLFVVSKQILTYLEYLVSFNNFFRITFSLLAFAFFSVGAISFGHSMFKDD